MAGVCPVCNKGFQDIRELERHVESHFSSPGPALPERVDPPEAIECPLGCGQMVPLTELESHEAMHRCPMQTCKYVHA